MEYYGIERLPEQLDNVEDHTSSCFICTLKKVIEIQLEEELIRED